MAYQKGKLTFVPRAELHPPYHDIVNNRADGDLIDTGTTTPYGERVYLSPTTIEDYGRSLGLVPESDLRAELEAERQKKIDVEKVLKEVLE